MKIRNSDNGAVPRHLDGDDLISYLDGELLREEQEDARTHLESCWNCRSRLSAVQNSIENFLRVRQERLMPPDLPPSGPALDLFTQRLADHSASVREHSPLRLRISQWGSVFRFFTRPLKLENPIPANSRLMVRTAAALLVTCIIAALVILSNRVTAVSANELIRFATDAQAQQQRATAQPVIHQKLQVRRKNSSVEESLSWEIWHDTTNSRLRQAVDDQGGSRFISSNSSPPIMNTNQLEKASSPAPTALVKLAEVLQANHMDPRRPLSPTSFQVWRNSVEPKQEEVTRATRIDGLEVLTLKTVPRGPVGMGGIAEANLVVRARDWHPIEEHLRVRGEQGDEEFDLVETSFDVVTLTALDPAIFSDHQTALLPENRPELPAELKPEPVAPVRAVVTADLDDAEVEARATLQRVGADLGEPIEIVRSASEVEVRGLVNTAERKAELIAALRHISHLKLTIKTIEEVSREAKSAAAPSTRSQPAEQPTSETIGNKLPVHDLLERYLARRSADPGEARSAMEQFSRQALTHAESALSEAWALHRLAERYTPAEVNRLNPSSRRKLEALARSHLRSLHLHITRASALVKPALSAIANESAGTIAANSGWEATWPKFSAPLLRTVQQLDRMTTALFTVGSNARVSPSIAARELLAAFALLESQLPHLEKRVAGEFLGNPESLVPKQP